MLPAALDVLGQIFQLFFQIVIDKEKKFNNLKSSLYSQNFIFSVAYECVQ